MKAQELPTKIYFTILDMGSGYVYTPSLDENGGTEYIRKDVLLNWLKEHINDYLVHGRDIDLMFDDIKNAF